MKTIGVDTFGQERYLGVNFNLSFFRGVHGVILVYDVTKRQSLVNLETLWLKKLVQMYAGDISVVIAATKCDISADEGRQVTAEEGREVARRLGFEHIETSAKDGTNVKLAFQMLITQIARRGQIGGLINPNVKIS